MDISDARRQQTLEEENGKLKRLLAETRANARWPLDFVHDQMANGLSFRIFNVVDDVTWECLASTPGSPTTIPSGHIMRWLTEPRLALQPH